SNAIFISDVIKNYYLNTYSFKSFTTIYDTVEYDSAIDHPRKFMEDGICRLLIAGFISEGKGQRDAIEATKILHQKFKIELTVCGQGNEEYVNSLIPEQAKNYIFYKGYQNNLAPYRQNSDIALVCSRMEALGRVTIESMYYENLVIGADSGCTPFLIKDHETGFLYRSGDPSDLAKKIEFAIQNNDLIDEIKAKAKNYSIKEFARDISSQILNVYQDSLINK
ncbi:glycosyltransferase family 4 protein, partial [Bifidobacterium olomucense]